MDENKTIEIAKDVIIEIQNIEVESAFETKVIMTTSKGRITWKAKAVTTDMVRGIPVKKTVAATPDQLPDKLFLMRNVLDKKGSCKVKCTYSVLKTTVDGEPKEYRFINGINPLDRWEILEESNEEQVS